MTCKTPPGCPCINFIRSSLLAPSSQRLVLAAAAGCGPERVEPAVVAWRGGAGLCRKLDDYFWPPIDYGRAVWPGWVERNHRACFGGARCCQ